MVYATVPVLSDAQAELKAFGDTPGIEQIGLHFGVAEMKDAGRWEHSFRNQST